MSALIAKDLTVRRSGRAILDHVSLTVRPGGLVVVIGANGAGKSTLLNTLAGLLEPDEGEIEFDGKPLKAWKGSDLARKRAFVPQNPRCDWPLPVERLVALGLTPRLPPFGGLTSGMTGRIDKALADCDLLALRDQPATTLSGGELGRAMLARALVGDPQALIIDEPTAGLDPRHALDAMARLKALAADGRLVIASIHDLTLAARYADTLIALKDGKLVSNGATAEVLTPQMLGDVFEVEARITATDHGPFIDLAPRS
jgi:iron complex transport system ATP-binding protein